MDSTQDRVVLGHLTATVMRARGERPDGRRYWRIRTRDTRETVSSGWWTHEEAIAAVAREVTRPRESRSSCAGEAARTVRDLLDAWGDAQVRRHAAGEIADCTAGNVERGISRWLATSVVDERLDRLTRALVSDQVTAWRAAGASARTVDYQVRTLRQAVRWGHERGLCPDVPLRIPTTARDDEHVYCGRVPSRLEVQAVLLALRPGPRRDAIEILGLTGARVGEVAALRVRDVDLAARTLRLSGRDEERGRRGKTRARLFPMRGRLLELAARLVGQDRSPDERLCSSDAAGLTRQLHACLGRASRRAGVDPVTPHGIRRLVVAELLEHADPKRVSELTGHSVTVLLRYYVRPTAAELGAVVEAAQLGGRR
jgi:integrase